MTAGAVAGWLLGVAASALWLSARRRLTRTQRLVARAEHELRGPVTAITLGIQSGLATGGMAAHTLRAIRAELERVTVALADLSAARAGRRGASTPAAVDLAQVLSDSVEAWRPAAAAAGVEIELSWDGVRQPLVGDRVRIAQATGNLIANAIEHGGGRVWVSADCDGHRGRVQVSDDGPGLAAAVLTGRSRARSSASRGHGLAIAADVAVAHGGTLRAEPARPGGGDELQAPGASLVLELPAHARTIRA